MHYYAIAKYLESLGAPPLYIVHSMHDSCYHAKRVQYIQVDRLNFMTVQFRPGVGGFCLHLSYKRPSVGVMCLHPYRTDGPGVGGMCPHLILQLGCRLNPPTPGLLAL